MSCEDLELSLDAYLDGEFEERERAEADAHVQGCESCRRRVESESRYRAALKGKLKAAFGPAGTPGRAPDALRQRLSRALDRERQPLWRRSLSPIPIATLAACAAGVAVVIAIQGGPDPMIEDAVRKHLRDLPLEVTAATADPAALATWFRGKIDFNASLPRFQSASVKVMGARLSNIRDRPAAYVRYELPRGHRGSLFVVDDPERRLGLGGHAVAGAVPVRMANQAGYNVAVWRQNEIVYSMVSDLDEPELVQLVSQLQPER